MKKEKKEKKPVKERNSVANRSLKYEMVMEYIRTGNYSEVARKFGRGVSGVQGLINRFILKENEEYERMCKLYMQNYERQMLYRNNYLMDKSLEKINDKLDEGDAPLNHLAMTYGVLYDKKALMQGKSTSNQAIIVKLEGGLEELSK